MGPDLELMEKPKLKMEVLASKENGNVHLDPEETLLQCAYNSEDRNFNLEALNDNQAPVLDRSEDVEVNIIDCKNSGENGQAEARCEDATDSMSSFGNTVSEAENGSSDTEAVSQFCVSDAPASILDVYSGAFRSRRKKLTDHWRRFICPLMWRCKWIELQIKEFQSQALKYDRELAEYERRKQFDFKTFVEGGLEVKLLPFSGCIQSRKIMKRKKRRRFEDKTDIASYMSQHNLFSYYENRHSTTYGTPMDDDRGNQDHNDAFGLQDGWMSLQSKGDDSILEDILSKIEMLKLQVLKLKAQIEKVVIENPGKFASLNQLSFPASRNALIISEQDTACPHEHGEDRKPLRPLHGISQHVPVSMMGSLMPESAVSSHGEVTPLPDMIESTTQPKAEEAILIDNVKTKEEMLNVTNFGCQLAKKLSASIEEQTVQASRSELPTETNVDCVDYAGKSLPKPRANVSTRKRKQDRRRM